LFGAGSLGLLGEMLLVCLAVAVLCVPVVTVLPALTAGCRHLNRFVDGEETTFRWLLRDFWQAWSKSLGWLWSLGVAALALLAVVDLLLATGNGVIGLELPGARLVAAVAAAVLAVAFVVVLWAASLWEPAARWREVIRVAALQAMADWRGSVLILVGFLASAVLVWMLPAMVILCPGLWCFAAVATDRRHQATAQ
jgi:uncharacterized membrane protein YesL